MLVIGVRHKPMKKLIVFRPPFGLNNDYGGVLNGVSSWSGVARGHSPLAWPRKLRFQWPRPCALVGTWGIFLAVKPEIVGIAGANMQWSHFICPSSGQKRESTAFDLILWSTWWLSSPGKQVSRSSTPCWKRSQVWDRESERWSKYMQ